MRLKAGGEGDDRGWDGWMASPTWWTGVWASSGSWWWTGKPDMLQSMESEHNWETELNWNPNNIKHYPITLKLCKFISEMLTVKAISPNESLLLWDYHAVNPDYLSRDHLGGSKTTWSGRQMPGQHQGAPFLTVATDSKCMAMSHTSRAKPFLSPWPIKTMRCFWVY